MIDRQLIDTEIGIALVAFGIFFQFLGAFSDV
jgi:hypothetical protein